MSKYKEFYEDMISSHEDLFDKFKTIHDKYDLSPEKNQEEFNIIGQDILQLIRRYENMLCGKSESGKYGKFSSKLSEKFWELIRSNFPKIDMVGQFI